MDAEPLCTLRDCTVDYALDEEFPFPDDLYTVQELVDHLRTAATRPPHGVHMDLPGPFRAVIAIGGPLAAISWVHLCYGRNPPADHPPALNAKPDRLSTTDYVEFFRLDSTLDIPADRLMPPEQVIQIAVYLAEHRSLPDTHVWLDAQGNRNPDPNRANRSSQDHVQRSWSGDIPF